MKTVDPSLFDNPPAHIPHGGYCYTVESLGERAKGIKINPCPFWDADEARPEQECGYCHYLKRGDWDINSQGGTIINMKTGEHIHLDYYPFGGLLWDMCKECGINDEYEE